MSAEVNIPASSNWFVGEDKQFVHTIKDSAGVAVNITGWALEWVLRRRPHDAAATLTKTTGSGVAITSGAGGVCTVSLSDTDTVSLEPGTYVYALRRTDDGFESVLNHGKAVLRQGASR